MLAGLAKKEKVNNLLCWRFHIKVMGGPLLSGGHFDNIYHNFIVRKALDSVILLLGIYPTDVPGVLKDVGMKVFIAELFMRAKQTIKPINKQKKNPFMKKIG